MNIILVGRMVIVATAGHRALLDIKITQHISADNGSYRKECLIIGSTSTLNASRNIAIGNSSFAAIVDGVQNTGIGYYAGTSLTTGDYNFALGSQASTVQHNRNSQYRNWSFVRWCNYHRFNTTR